MLYLAVFNVLVALVWALLKGEINLVNLVWGYLLGAAGLLIFRQVNPGEIVTRRVGGALVLFAVFLVELVKANLQVLRIVFSPTIRARSGIIALPLDVKTDWGITLLANLITLTPGTISLDVAPDRKQLFIHILDISHPEEVKESIKETFERRIREVFE